jgi:hypothetical protein
MSAADRMRYLAQGLASRLSATSAALRRRIGLAPEALDGVSLPERPPDSRLARDAEALCREVSTPSLFNHCLRVYLWGALLAARDRLSYDEELLFVASALHDLGLTERFAGVLADVPCFAVEGAVAARDWALGQRCDPARARRLANAISLHVNPRVGVRRGVEEHLLTAGAAFDVVGARYHELGRPLVSAALERYPRCGFKREMDERSRAAAVRGPRTRVALAYRVGFAGLIAGAPFRE